MNKKQKIFVVLVSILFFAVGIIILSQARGVAAFSLGIISLLPLISLIAFKLFFKEEKDEDED